MKIRHPLLLVSLTALAVFALCGCSSASKAARFLAAADRHYEVGALDKAEVEYLNVLKLQPLNAIAIGRLGLIYTAQGKTNRAVAFVLKGAELNPDNVDVRLKAGQIHVAMGRMGEARTAAEFVISKRPSDPDAPLLLVSTLANAADVEVIRTRLKAIPAPASTQAPVLVALAALELRTGKLPEAENLLQSAKAADPKYAPTYSTWAALHLARKQVAEASDALRQAAVLSPPRSPILLQYAQFKIRTGNVEEGRKVMLDITRKTPDYVPAWVALGELALAEKKLPEGAQSIDKAISLDPQNFQALILKGRLHNERAEYDKSIALLEKLVESYPRVPFVHQEIGRAYAATGDLNKAIASLGQALAIAPENPDAALLLAQLHGRKGDFPAAVTLLRRLVEQRPDLAQARLLLADTYRAQNNLEQALQLYQQLEQQQPGNFQFPLLRGMVYIQGGRRKEAREALERAAELAPGNPAAIEQVINLDIQEGKYPAARSRIDAEIARDPKFAALGELMRAKTFLAEENQAAAEVALKRSIEVNPELSTAYFLLAGIYSRTNQQDAALAQLEQVLARDPKQTSALMLTSIIYDQKGDVSRAKEGYEKLLTINPRSAVALNNLAYLYSEKLNDLEKAQDLAQKARQLLPADPRTADTLGWISFKRRQLTWAGTLLQEAAEKAPTSGEIQYHAGAVQYAIGNEQAAREYLQRALKLEPTAEWVDTAQLQLDVLNIPPNGGVADAEKVVDRALQVQPDDSVALIRKAASLEQGGKVDDAISLLERVRSASQTNVQLLLTLARLHNSANRREQALELAKAARKLAPTDPEVGRALAQLALRNGDFVWAANLLQDAVRQFPDSAELQLDFARAQYAIGRIPEAREAYKQVIRLEESNARSISRHATDAENALELIPASDQPQASPARLELAEKVLSSDPGSLPALIVQASSQELADRKLAIKTYEQALKLAPDFTPAKVRVAILAAQEEGFEKRHLDWAQHARTAFPSNRELAKALGILTFRGGDAARSVSLLKEYLSANSTDSEAFYYLGLAQIQARDTISAKKSLARALDLGLRDPQSAAAKRALEPLN